ncbi:MAG: hypothetical protein RR588_12375 [Solibacillus sp.]
MASIEKEETLPKSSAQAVGEKIKEVIEEKSPQKKFMYVGPPTKTLPKFTIYEGGIPSFAKEQFEKCPALKTLFINPAELTKFQLLFADGNSVQSMFYKKVEEYFSEVK